MLQSARYAGCAPPFGRRVARAFSWYLFRGAAAGMDVVIWPSTSMYIGGKLLASGCCVGCDLGAALCFARGLCSQTLLLLLPLLQEFSNVA